MTVEELEIIVTAKVQDALKDLPKLIPAIKNVVRQAKENFEKIDAEPIKKSINNASTFVKKKVQDLKKSSKNNEITIKVNNQDAKKQITQLEKQIDSLQEKITARQMKLDIINPQIDKIVDDTKNEVTPNGVSKNSNSMDKVVNNALSSNKEFTMLNNQAQKLYTEIEIYNKELNNAKSKVIQLKQDIEQVSTSQSKWASFFDELKGKITQTKGQIGGVKQTFGQMPKITQNITNNIKKASVGIKSGLKHVLKYAAALFSIRGIYSILSNSAQSWLSSQNAVAQQLSANIEYLKYALGSVFAPVIEYVVNLVYKLMKAIQSVVYAFSGINIFAKATASSMGKTAKSAKDTNKSLTGVHNEINNVSEKDNSGDSGNISPNMDLSKISKITDKIDWASIKEKAGNLGKNLALYLNEGLKNTNWEEVGNNIAQAINTVLNLAYEFVSNFKFEEFGRAIGETVSSLFKNFEFSKYSATLSKFAAGLFLVIAGFFQELDWSAIFNGLWSFITGYDWNGLADAIFKALGSACASLINLGMVIGECIGKAFEGINKYFQGKIEECGGDIVGGIFKGIGDAIKNVGQWINDHIFQPFIEGFCNAFGIHSPSTVFAEFGQNIIQGLFNGIKSLVNKVKEIWEKIKETAVTIFNSVKENISNIVNNIKNTISNVLNTIKTVWNNIWNGLKTTVSNIFNGIWNVIKNVINSILGGIEGMANGVIKGINFVIKALNKVNFNIPDWVPVFGGKKFGFNIGLLSEVSLPRLDKGNVAYNETLAVFGEYSGAKTNPEITAPQNILRDTFEEVLSNHDDNNSDRPINLNVIVGNKKLGEILIEDLQDRKRRTGKGIEAYCN